MRTANEIAVASAVLVLAGGPAADAGEIVTGSEAGDGDESTGSGNAADQAARSTNARERRRG